MPPSESANAMQERMDSDAREETQTPPSPWLYLAGLVVTLSGLYAVNFRLEASNFPFIAYGLATIGYVFSYIMRLKRISLRALQTPFLIVLSVAIFLAASSERGLEWFLPPEATIDRAKGLQMVFVWLAILHSFTLAADAAVLFACVPCMTMIALVSTLEAGSEVQNTFLIFIGAATFLMVHENYLRTKQARLVGRREVQERRLFGGQLQLAAFCVVGALTLANYVAIPIRSVGQLFLPTGFTGIGMPQRNQQPQDSRPVQVTENNVKELATGPVGESNVILMRVNAERGLYWRGATFDLYTGTSFRDTLSDKRTIAPTKRDSDLMLRGSAEGLSSDRILSPTANMNLFEIPLGRTELPPDQMKNASLSKQDIIVESGIFTNLYGAGNVEQTLIPQIASLVWDEGGGITTNIAVPQKTVYTMMSRVADDAPDTLRMASSKPEDVPSEILRLYLQKARDDADLTALAKEITKGKSNNYDRAVAIKDYIGAQCKYNLQTPSAPRDRDIVKYFLTESKMGYCDSFAAAMTILCRYAGIPARLASGFLPGEVQNGQYVVRERHKHMWSEVFFPKVGWIVFDATEGAEDISDHSALGRQKPRSFLTWLLSNGWLPPVIGVVCIGLLGYLFKVEVWDRLRPRHALGGHVAVWSPANLEIIQTYLAACNDLARRGLAREPSMTPNEYLRFVSERSSAVLPELREPLAALTALFVRIRYSTDEATGAEAEQAKAHQAELSRLLQQAKRNAFQLPPVASKEQA